MHHRSYRVALYCRAYEVLEMADAGWLQPRWEAISENLRIDRIYLETHRDLKIVPSHLLDHLKRFFRQQGIETVGGVTLTVSEPNRFETFCYTKEHHRRQVREIVEHTARHFDEFILDDFFFTNCKCEECIAAKGERTWTDFRLALMREAAQTLILGPAKAANPDVKVVIKYPNWYEGFQGLGFDLEQEPAMFDGIHTGTETRQPVYNHQHLQPYHGYSIVRYFENIARGRNGGGWVDTGSMRTEDRYAEQLWMTLFAKAPEMTLFDWRQALYPWEETNIAAVAERALNAVDPVLEGLGKPIGVPSYRPAHATGEEYLLSYLGMIGIPIDLRPSFPEGKRSILLTESAAYDPKVVAKIERAVRDGATVTITSGLLAALQSRGIQQVVEAYTGREKVLTDEFYRRGEVLIADAPMLLPQVRYHTNDAWEIVGASENGYPLLLQAGYGKGFLNVLAIPDNPMDLYRLPVPALDVIRQTVGSPFSGPSRVSLFLYDNGEAIVHSFRDEAVEVRVGEQSVALQPHRFARLTLG